MEYSSYLQTEHWKITRELKIKEKLKCWVCGSNKNLIVHHKRYKNKDGSSVLFKEDLKGLVVLCSSCHRLVHYYFGIDVNKLNKKICRVKRLMELGVLKNKAFWIVSNNELYLSIINKVSPKNKTYSPDTIPPLGK